MLLFPDGHLPFRRLRWVLWAYLAVAPVWMVSAYSFTVSAIARHDIRVDSAGNLQVLSHPTGSAAWWGAVQDTVLLVIAVSWLVSLAGQVISYRGSSGERRQQLKWLMGGSVVLLAGLILRITLSSGPGWPNAIGGVGVLLVVFALPVSMGVAILKYRLYDIDRLLSRTLAYAIVTGLLVGVYAGLVLLATQVLGLHTPVAVAAATLAAAALFNPVRRRVQRAVDRRFNRARYDADQTVAAFAARLKDAVELDAVRSDLTGVVQAALEPAHVWVWTARLRGKPVTISACGISEDTIVWADIRTRGRTGESSVTDRLDRWADPPLLVLASLAAEPKHGYAITQDVAETMGVRLSAGTLYAVIARLEARGLIEPLETDDRRRPYRITMAGAQALAQQSERMSKVASVARERLSTSLGWAAA